MQSIGRCSAAERLNQDIEKSNMPAKLPDPSAGGSDYAAFDI